MQQKRRVDAEDTKKRQCNGEYNNGTVTDACRY